MTADLQTGMRNPEVGNWQQFLNTKGASLVVDEDFGRLTELATKVYQVNESLVKTGMVNALTRKRGIDQGFIPFVLARNYTLVPVANPRKIDVIVIHTMEAPGKPTTAENVAAWFAGSTAPRASAHYCLDVDSTVQCVRDRDVAWHAPGANHNGIGIEHAGYAKQSAADWDSAYNVAMLDRSARLTAKLCKEYNIPVQLLTPDALKSKLRGICGHVDVTNAFSGGIGHSDPGRNFPWTDYIALVDMYT